MVYADSIGTALRHSAFFSDGALDGRSEVLSTPWNEVVPDPVVVSGGGDNLRVLFGGMSSDSGYDKSGRMYGASSSDGGTAWSLDAVAAGKSVQAHAQDGTAATTLSDHTPVAGFALGKQLVWHVGESNASPDQSYLAGADVVSLSHPTFVRSGSEVWAGWLQQGTTTETTGFFAMRILPTLGTPAKAPGSSVGTQTVAWQTRTPSPPASEAASSRPTASGRPPVARCGSGTSGPPRPRTSGTAGTPPRSRSRPDPKGGCGWRGRTACHRCAPSVRTRPD